MTPRERDYIIEFINDAARQVQELTDKRNKEINRGV